MQSYQERGGHALAIYDHPCDVGVLHVLLIALKQRRNTHRQVLISPMGRDQEGMAMLVVQQEERPAPQDDAQAPDESSRNEHVTVDRLAMAVNIAGQCLRRLPFLPR